MTGLVTHLDILKVNELDYLKLERCQELICALSSPI